MISRLTASAAAFAILATTTLALAAGHSAQAVSPVSSISSATAQPMPVIQMERVVVTGKRIRTAA